MLIVLFVFVRIVYLCVLLFCFFCFVCAFCYSCLFVVVFCWWGCFVFFYVFVCLCVLFVLRVEFDCVSWGACLLMCCLCWVCACLFPVGFVVLVCFFVSVCCYCVLFVPLVLCTGCIWLRFGGAFLLMCCLFWVCFCLYSRCFVVLCVFDCFACMLFVSVVFYMFDLLAFLCSCLSVCIVSRCVLSFFWCACFDLCFVVLCWFCFHQVQVTVGRTQYVFRCVCVFVCVAWFVCVISTCKYMCFVYVLFECVLLFFV